jgi:hypothetical protein
MLGEIQAIKPEAAIYLRVTVKPYLHLTFTSPHHSPKLI